MRRRACPIRGGDVADASASDGASPSRGPRRPPSSVVRAIAALCVAAAAVAGCGRGGTYEITEVRERTDEDPPPPEASLAQRFRPERMLRGDDPHAGIPGMPGGLAGGGGGASAPRAPAWTWKTPEGWKDVGPAAMRVTAWQVAADTDCSFATLPAAGGGLAANVDRWRAQMSLPPEGEAGVAKLPRAPMLGREAVRVELAGTFVGMGGAKNLPDAKLLGLVVELPAFTAFLKLTGPAAAVDAATPAFLALAASIAPAEPSASAGAGPAGPASGAPEGFDPTLAPFSWSAPAAWVRQPAKPMRLATFVPAGATKTEVYVARLTGTAGGTKPNLDRWRAQMGQPALTDAEFEALPRTTILGGTAILLSVEGTFTGMGGAGAAPASTSAPGAGQRLLGMALERPGDMVFVKMVGPADEVLAEEGRFKAFCESFHE